MTIAEFVHKLAARRIELFVSEGQLRYRGPQDEIDDSVLSEISSRKSALLDYLQDDLPDPELLPRGARPLSHGQEALWFLYELDRSSTAYNTLYAPRLSGDLDATLFEAAVEDLTRRHPVLRTRFGSAGGQPYQEVLPGQSANLEITDVKGWSYDRVEQYIAELGDRPFDLENGPAARWHLLTGVVNGALPTPVLVFVAHHIIVDFRSLEILMRDLSRLYAERKAGRRADRTDDRNRAAAAVECLYVRCSLVKARQPRTQIGRESVLSR